jgi:hypothetical protein
LNLPLLIYEKKASSDVIFHDSNFIFGMTLAKLSAHPDIRLNGGRSYVKLKISRALRTLDEQLNEMLVRDLGIERQ